MSKSKGRWVTKVYYCPECGQEDGRYRVYRESAYGRDLRLKQEAADAKRHKAHAENWKKDVRKLQARIKKLQDDGIKQLNSKSPDSISTSKP